MASPVETPAWDRGERCKCKGCTIARAQGARDERTKIFAALLEVFDTFKDQTPK